jgi:hypothetical protein
MIYIDKLPKIIGIAFAITVLLFAGYGGYIGMKATKMCKSECNIEGAMGSYLSRTGSWKVDDTCVCFFKDKIRVFSLNEKELCNIKDVCEIDLGLNMGGLRP